MNDVTGIRVTVHDTEATRALEIANKRGYILRRVSPTVVIVAIKQAYGIHKHYDVHTSMLSLDEPKPKLKSKRAGFIVSSELALVSALVLTVAGAGLMRVAKTLDSQLNLISESITSTADSINPDSITPDTNLSNPGLHTPDTTLSNLSNTSLSNTSNH